MLLRLVMVSLMAFAFTGYLKVGQLVRIETDVENAIIYVDDHKRGMIVDGFTTIFASEGKYHKVRVYVEIDDEWYREGTKDVFVGAESLMQVKIDTQIKPTKKRLKKQKNWVFIDPNKKLMWQDDEQTKTEKKPWVTMSNWHVNNFMDTSGDTATSYCSNLLHAGHKDWRLPTKSELEDLYRKKSKLRNYSSHYYWSSTEYEDVDYVGWVVDFNIEESKAKGKYDSHYVRCVRVLE